MSNFKWAINGILIITQAIFYGVMIIFAIKWMSTLDSATAFIDKININIEIDYGEEENN
jgi:hypothetical protein